ncbi:NADH-quinone oxidoreductase, chain I [Candidatus Magnetoovum chiemensis]|nr:NADH-quinone oxidoreductase, chain I [Candidatus Magnetoovum chiemensis]
MEKYNKIITRYEDKNYKSKLKKFVKNVFLVEIIQGMKLTFNTMFTKPVTRRYPKEIRIAKQGFRGMHALVRNSATGGAKCVGCGLCAAICPSKCINIYTSEGENHEKVVDRYEIDVSRCVYCSFCVEACPFQSIVLTEHYDYTGYSRKDLYLNKERLLENWDKYMEGEKGRIYFEKFWGPREKYFISTDDQPVFKGNSL